MSEMTTRPTVLASSTKNGPKRVDSVAPWTCQQGEQEVLDDIPLALDGSEYRPVRSGRTRHSGE